MTSNRSPNDHQEDVGVEDVGEDTSEEESARGACAVVCRPEDRMSVLVQNSKGVTVADKIVTNHYHGQKENKLDEIQERTKNKLSKFEKDKVYETRVIRQAQQQLNKGMVVVEGPDKSGKTSLGMYLLKHFDPDYVPLIIKLHGNGLSGQDLRGQIGSKAKRKLYVILIDDMDELNKPLQDLLLQDLCELVEDGLVHLIITIASEHLWDPIHKSHGEILRGRHRVKLHDCPLQSHERYEILKMHKLKFGPPQRNEGANEKLLMELAEKMNYPWFLYVLEEAHQRQQNLVEFFTNPESFLIDCIAGITKSDHMDRFAALVLIMKQGFIDTSNPPSTLQSPEPNSTWTILAGLLGIQFLNTKKILDAAKYMIGVYTTLTNERYEFIHKSISHAVCSVFYEFCQNTCLSWCPIEFLISKTDLPKHHNHAKCVIADEHIEQVIHRFREHPNVLEIIHHPGFLDIDFVVRMMKELKERLICKRYREILIEAISLGRNGLVNHIVGDILRTLQDAGKAIKQIALEEACRVGNKDAFDALIKKNAEIHSHCMVACKTGKNRGIVEYFTMNQKINYQKISRDAVEDWITIIVESDCCHLITTMMTNIRGRPDQAQLFIFIVEVLCKKAGNYDQLKKAINEVERLDVNWKHMLALAIEGGEVETVKYILGRDENIQLEDPCITAIKFNRSDVVEHFLEKDSSLIKRLISSGHQLLHLASSVSFKENPKTLDLILRQRIDFDVNAKDGNESTALHLAASEGNIKSVKLLIGKGANIRATDYEGNTPLHAHFSGDFVNKPVAETLLTSDVEHQNNDQITPLHLLCNKNKKTPLHLLCSNIRAVHASILKAMIDKRGKASVNMQDLRGQIPLHIVIKSSAEDVAVVLLLEAGSDLLLADSEGQTAFHHACQAGQHDIINMLIDTQWKSTKKRIVPVRNSRGETPLHCYLNSVANVDTVKSLLSDDPEYLEAKDDEGQTILHASMKTAGNTEVIQLLLKEHADVNANDTDGRSPLHVLAGICHVSSCEAALELIGQPSMDVNVQDSIGWTPLHHACSSRGPNSSELVRTILSKDADALRKDRSGKIALHCVCKTCDEQSPKVLQELVRHHKIHDDIQRALSIKDKHGDTPLHKIGFSGGMFRKDVAHILISAGADVTEGNFSGDTVLDIARRNELEDIVQILVEASLVKACMHLDELHNAHRLLSRELSPDVASKDQINEMFRKVVQIDGPNTITVLELLSERGAEANASSHEGLTPIHLVAMKPGQFTGRILDYLISKGGDITQTDATGETALHKATSGRTIHRSELVKLLCAKGIPVDGNNIEGKTPLHKFLSGIDSSFDEDGKSTLEAFISLEADVKVINKQMAKIGKEAWNIILHVYCTKREMLNDEDVKHIMQQGADINSKDTDGNSVLHRICMRKIGLVDKNVQVLLNNGADKFSRNKELILPFDVACNTGLKEDVRERLYTQEKYPEDLETDGPTSPMSPTSPTSSSSMGRPPWFRRSSSGEGWPRTLRQGMLGIRNAAGMEHFQDDMEAFEKRARYKLDNHFNRFM